MRYEEVKEQGITVTLSKFEMEQHLFHKIDQLCIEMKQGVSGFYPVNPEISDKDSFNSYFNKLRVEFDKIEVGAIALYQCEHKKPSCAKEPYQFVGGHEVLCGNATKASDSRPGELRALTNAQYMNELMESSERERKEAYEQFMNQFRCKASDDKGRQ